jgi:hypothetical protein
MRPRCGHLLGNLLAAWLIVLASGDDFNVCRIAIPLLPSSSPSHALPLDDPNTDFTRAEVAQATGISGSHAVLLPLFLDRQQEQSFLTLPVLFSFHDPCPLSDHPGHLDPYSCLRC